MMDLSTKIDTPFKKDLNVNSKTWSLPSVDLFNHSSGLKNSWAIHNFIDDILFTQVIDDIFINN